MASTNLETIDDDHERGGESAGAVRPGVVIVYSDQRPRSVALPLVDGAIELGRDELAAVECPDGRVSRRHVRVEREGERWAVRDLGSRNGTFVDGRPAQVARNLAAPVVRIGHTVLLPVRDVVPFQSGGIAVRDGAVVGPALAAFYDRVAAVARSGSHLLILGESGAGKELAAATFHAATGAARPLLAVNCATIPPELAERVLFGATRGAYTGAVADAPGLVQAADGGTLFLDEIAELAPSVQAKLLRVLETRQVTPLGGVKAVPVSLRLCAATLKDLRAEVTQGRFRGDLYFRIGRPGLRLPSLSDRREEIPWLIDLALSGAGAKAAASAEFVENCLTRSWPGNVRELFSEVAIAKLSADSLGRSVLGAADLSDEAGRPLESSDDATDADQPNEPIAPGVVEAALREEQGNVARAAARLGFSRGRVRRYIEREGIDLRELRGPASSKTSGTHRRGDVSE